MSDPRDMVVRVLVQSMSAGERTAVEAICMVPQGDALRALLTEPTRVALDRFKAAIGRGQMGRVAAALSSATSTILLHAIGETDPLAEAPRWVKHVLIGRRPMETPWCGASYYGGWAFVDAAHAIANAAMRDYLQICPVCALVMTEALRQGMWDGKLSKEERAERDEPTNRVLGLGS